jgi:hypothetical protein
MPPQPNQLRQASNWILIAMYSRRRIGRTLVLVQRSLFSPRPSAHAVAFFWPQPSGCRSGSSRSVDHEATFPLLRCNNIRLVEGPRSGPSGVSNPHGEFAMKIMLAVVITALGVLFVTLAARATIGSHDYPVQAQGLPLVY